MCLMGRRQLRQLDVDSDDDDGRGCDCPARMEAPEPPAYR